MSLLPHGRPSVALRPARCPGRGQRKALPLVPLKPKKCPRVRLSVKFYCALGSLRWYRWFPVWRGAIKGTERESNPETKSLISQIKFLTKFLILLYWSPHRDRVRAYKHQQGRKGSIMMILGIRHAMCLSVAASALSFVVVRSAVAGTYYVPATVSVGVHGDKDTLFTPGAPCTIMGGTHDTDEPNYMLLWFDLTKWPDNPEISAVSLQLTRESGDIPGSSPAYAVKARAFYAGNDAWYTAPDHVTGNYQYFDLAGDDDTAWTGGTTSGVRAAGNDYLGGTNTWDATDTRVTVGFGSNCAKIEKWVTGTSENNGMLLYCSPNLSNSPFFYGADAAAVADRPTLIIEAESPEPTTVAILLSGGCLLLLRRRRAR